jgi:hypothetical protein
MLEGALTNQLSPGLNDYASVDLTRPVRAGSLCSTNIQGLQVVKVGMRVR